MEDVSANCCVCFEQYSHCRKPLLLPCQHSLCASCVNTQSISTCPLCRKEIGGVMDLPTHDQLLSAVLQSRKGISPSSFPIGLLDDGTADDGPGTPPYPSAPAFVEIQPCDTDTDDSSRRATGESSHRSRRSSNSSSTSGGGSGSGSGELARSSSRLGPQQSRPHLSNSHNCSNSPPGAGSSHGCPSVGSLPHANAAGALIPRAPFAGTGSLTGLQPHTRAAGPSSSSSSTLRRATAPDRLSLTGTTWAAANHAFDTAGNRADIAGTAGEGAGGTLCTIYSAPSTASQQALLSFPVQDLDPYQEEFGLPDSDPDSPTAPLQAPSSPTTAAGACSSNSSSIRTLGPRAALQSMLQAAGSSCLGLLQQLAVPWAALPQQGYPQQSGLPTGCIPHQPSSVILATLHSCLCCWASYTSALQRMLAACQQAHQQTQAALEHLLQRLGLPPGYGHLTLYWLTTCLLGFLMYHWQLGLQLLPIGASTLALAALGAMQPIPSSSSSSGGPSSSSSTIPSSTMLPVWPSQVAGALLAGVCLLLGLLACSFKQLGLAEALLLQLLAVTPQVLALVGLLLWGQVVVEVLHRGWGSYAELKQASLLCRCWSVAAAGILAARSTSSIAATLALAATWVQKAHLLLIEGPVLVMHAGALMQPALLHVAGMDAAHAAEARQQQQPGSSRADHCSTSSTRQDGLHLLGGNSSSHASSSHSQRRGFDRSDSALSARVPDSSAVQAQGNSNQSCNYGSNGTSALLYCVHGLLQLLVVLYVPPAPVAAATWMPQLLRGLLVWGARVMLCGCCMQVVLQGISGSNNDSSGDIGSSSRHTEPHTAAPILSSLRNRLGAASSSSSSSGCYVDGGSCLQSPSSSRQGSCVHRMSSCAASAPPYAASAPSACAAAAAGCGGGACCVSPVASPSPRRQCWELQLHDSSYHTSYGSHHNSTLMCTGIASGDALDGSSRGGSWGLIGFSSGLGVPFAMWAGSAAGTVGPRHGWLEAAAGALVWQHAAYLLLLLGAFAGDTLITAATPSVVSAAAVDGGAEVWGVRLAWHRCLEWLMVVGLCVELAGLLRREVRLLLRLPAIWGPGFGGAAAAAWQHHPWTNRRPAGPAVW